MSCAKIGAHSLIKTLCVSVGALGKAKVVSISSEEYRVNEQIRGGEPRALVVQGESGKSENLGVKTFREALEIARERGLDLVEVAPNEDPPVCRVMDYSKFLYERSKKEREARKAQKTIEVKEIQLQLKINEFHLASRSKMHAAG